MKKIINTFLVAAALFFGTAVFVAPVAYAETDCAKTPDAAVCQVQTGVKDAGGSSNTTSLTTIITNIINVLLFIAGALAVIMIIIGGFRYMTSNGEQAHIKAAKDTIMYSIVGLIVALLAYAIVNFIVSKF